jgi:hypothetical protein
MMDLSNTTICRASPRMLLKGNEMREMVLMILLIVIIVFGFILNSCTYSVTLAHTEGQATDLIDETQTAQPDVQADLTIPAI